MDVDPTPDEAPGWDSITEAFTVLYGEQDPVHRAPIPPPAFGGALQGISAYRATWGWHFVTYGLTELFQKDSDEPTVSGWGYELTMLTVPGDEPPEWAWRILYGLAATTVETGRWHAIGDRIDLSEPLDGAASRLTALAVRADPLAIPRASPFGDYGFHQLVGVTRAELEEMRRTSTDAVLGRLADHDALLRIDPQRT